MKPNDLILRRAAQRSLEGRSSVRHRSFEAPLRCAPQDEVEKYEHRCVVGPFLQHTHHWNGSWNYFV